MTLCQSNYVYALTWRCLGKELSPKEIPFSTFSIPLSWKIGRGNNILEHWKAIFGSHIYGCIGYSIGEEEYPSKTKGKSGMNERCSEEKFWVIECQRLSCVSNYFILQVMKLSFMEVMLIFVWWVSQTISLFWLTSMFLWICIPPQPSLKLNKTETVICNILPYRLLALYCH